MWGRRKRNLYKGGYNTPQPSGVVGYTVIGPLGGERRLSDGFGRYCGETVECKPFVIFNGFGSAEFGML